VSCVVVCRWSFVVRRSSFVRRSFVRSLKFEVCVFGCSMMFDAAWAAQRSERRRCLCCAVSLAVAHLFPENETGEEVMVVVVVVVVVVFVATLAGGHGMPCR